MILRTKIFIQDIARKFNMIFDELTENLISQFSIDTPIISQEAHNYLKNPSDKIEIDKAVFELKNKTNSKTTKSKTLNLSNNKRITIIVD